MIVGRLASATAERLVMLAEGAPVRVAANSFADRRLGLIVVCDGSGKAKGVISKSDLVRHLREAGTAETPVSAVMTRDVIACSPAHLLVEVWHSMKSRQLQNVPVLEDSWRPVGVLDIRDALHALLREEQDQERMLVNYISGFGYC